MRKETWFFYFLFFKKGEGNEWFWMLSEDQKNNKGRSQHVHKLSNREWQNQRGKSRQWKMKCNIQGHFWQLISMSFPSPLRENILVHLGRKHSGLNTFLSSDPSNQTLTKNIFSILFSSQFSIFPKIS